MLPGLRTFSIRKHPIVARLAGSKIQVTVHFGLASSHVRKLSANVTPGNFYFNLDLLRVVLDIFIINLVRFLANVRTLRCHIVSIFS